MADDARDKLIEDLHELLVTVVETSDRALEKAELQRKVDVQTVAKAFLTEKLAERQEFIAHQKTLRGKLNALHESVSKLPKPAHDGVAGQIAELSNLVRQFPGRRAASPVGVGRTETLDHRYPERTRGRQESPDGSKPDRRFPRLCGRQARQ